jgi:pilus assembly protein CpaE
MPLAAGVVVFSPDLSKEVQSCLEESSVRVVIRQPQIGDWDSFLDKIERLRPDVILVELAGLWDEMEAAFHRIRTAPAAPAIVGLHTAKDAESILRAVRAGATEYLYPPYAAGLRSALERLGAERKPEDAVRGRGRVIGFLSAKGGCGATTIACHTAVEVPRQTSKHALLIDFDLESAVAGFLLKAKGQYSVLDALNNVHRLDQSYWKALVSNGIPGLEVLSAPPYAPVRPLQENERIRQVLRFVRGHYDWTVVDLGRGLGSNILSALEEIDDTCLVTTVDVPALYRAKYIARTLRDAGYKHERLHIVLNRVPRNPDVTPTEIERMLGAPVKATLPEDQAALYESYADGKLLPANSSLGRQINRLAARLTGAPEKPAKKKFAILG